MKASQATQASQGRDTLGSLSLHHLTHPLLSPSREIWPKATLRLPDYLVPTGKITSSSFLQPNSPQQTPSDFPWEYLNFGPALRNRPSSPPTATIYPNPFYTTASQTSPWLPQSSPSTGQSASSHSPQNHPPTAQSDFVLYPSRRSFEVSPNALGTHSLSESQALGGAYRRHSSHQPSAQSFVQPSAQPSAQSAAHTLQNQRVAAIIQGTGHSTTSTAFTNRYSPAQKQFYASSAPSSSVALQAQPSRPRPQVPAFSQSTGSIPQKQSFPPVNMNQDMDLYDSYSSFPMDAATDSPFQASYHSPAVPTTYDLDMVRTNSGSTNVGTVSPQDLMVRDPSFSAPNSTAFTNLTSPSDYHVSPGFNDLESSPLFNNDNLDGAQGSDGWFSLFPPSNTDAATSNPLPADQSLEPDEELVVSEHLRNNSQHRRSGSSPGNIRASDSAGVSARKRNQPLPPIVIEDPNDTVAMKRARNTLAARKSRQKKMERFDELENEISTLKKEVDHWKQIALNRKSAQE